MSRSSPDQHSQRTAAGFLPGKRFYRDYTCLSVLARIGGANRAQHTLSTPDQELEASRVRQQILIGEVRGRSMLDFEAGGSSICEEREGAGRYSPYPVSGGASQRASNYRICKNLLLECTLGCPLHVQEGDRDVQSPTSRQLGSREVVVPGFVAEGVKANKGDNSTCTQKAGHVAPSYNTSMSSSHREESNAGLFGDHSAV